MKTLSDQFCVIDIETKGLSARPERFVFGCLYGKNGSDKKIFHTHSEMVKYLLSKSNPYKYIFAHNGEFDFTILFDNLIRNFDNSSLFVGSTFIKSKSNNIPLNSTVRQIVKNPCPKKQFCNSLTVLKTSVYDLGKNLGIEKMELADKFKDWKEGDGEIEVNHKDIEYCFRDCEIVYHFLTKMYEKVGKIKFTVASCAMEIFTKQFLKFKLQKNENNEIFRESYYGGRVECFRFGKIIPIYKYDVNSLYPFVCTRMVFPHFAKLRKGRNLSLLYFKNYILKNYEGCANVTIEHEENFVGVLPYRKKFEIIFPYGVFTATYNFNELRAALETGLIRIKKVHYYVFAPKFDFKELKEYMLHFYKEKCTQIGAEYVLTKFLLNGLTGKFGQKEYGQKTYYETTEEITRAINDLPEGTKYKELHFSEDRDDWFLEVFRKEKPKKIQWNIPTISSYITSEARAYMLKFLVANEKSICYTDTDSLVLTKPLDKKYISDSILGLFKKEHDSEIEIIGNKHYKSVVKGKKVTHIKGVGRNYKFKKIKSGIHKGKDGYHFNRMIRTKEGLKQDKDAGVFLEVVKHMANDYTKRKVVNNKTKTIKLTKHDKQNT